MVDANQAMRTINRLGVYLLITVLFLNFVGISHATGITSALTEFCKAARQFLIIGIMLMIILAAAVYAVGQILGAETRARASVWATAMMMGAVIGMLIYLIVPWVIGMMDPTLNVSTACG